MEYILPICILLLLTFILFKVYINEPVGLYFYPALAIKITAGIIIGIVYTKFYPGGDTFAYFSDAVLIKSFAMENPVGFLNFLFTDKAPDALISGLNFYTSEPRALFFSKICGIVNLVSADNYYILSLYFSLISFWGFLFLTNHLTHKFPHLKTTFAVSFLLFPSVVFWSSGVIKESLSVGSLAILLGILVSQFIQKGDRSKSILYGILFLFFLWLSWSIKYYYAGVFIACFGPVVIISMLKKYDLSPSKKLMVWLLFSTLSLTLLTFTKYNFSIEILPEVIRQNYQAFADKSNPGDYIVFKNFESSWIYLLKNSPVALLSGLFRPHIFEIDSFFKMFVALENLLIFLLLMFNLKNIPLLLKSKYNFWILATIIYISILATFLAFSTPNFGSLVRYKSGFLFLLVFLSLLENPLIKQLKNPGKYLWKSR